MNKHVLHGSIRSPYTRKVRILLAEKSIEYEWSRDYYAFLQDVNPLGKVPVLMTPTGNAIFDSPVICEYLESLVPDPPMLPGAEARRLEIKQWEALADGICDAAVATVNERAREIASERSAAFIARQRGKIEMSIAYAERHLGAGNWCSGQEKTLADIAVYTALRYVGFRLPEIDWQAANHRLADYANTLDELPTFASSAPY